MVVLSALPAGLFRSLQPLIDLMVCDSSKSFRSKKIDISLGETENKHGSKRSYSRGRAKRVMSLS